ncbi:MAG: DUF2851 family protein [Bacteroidetes bacterium]|nr:DUF2851 family protein [Bacteroidota bacterium]MBK8873074.1 DUF2851 family protein [Bacteroidota bacterium]
MNEDFLSFVWKYRLYSKDLVTTSGETVTVLKPGEQHRNAGPDFFNARIRIGDTLWAGNIEIHVKASDWYRHMHQHDKAYNSVILHVVYEADAEIIINDMTTVPTVCLATQTEPGIIQRYRDMRLSPLTIPCGSNISEVPPPVLNIWLERMLVERLEQKSLVIEQALQVNRGDWDDAFYQLLARNFGFNINAGPFEMLARCMPRKLLLKHADQLQQVEALLFGQAGFLEDEFTDDYPKALQAEYRFLAKKYGLMPLDRHIWKQLRMRPANFPTLRISQFASIWVSGRVSFQVIREIDDMHRIMNLFQVRASHYWCNHFVFDKTTRFAFRHLGDTSVKNILINTIAPFLFYYGKTMGDEKASVQAYSILQGIPSEVNHLLTEWSRLGIEVENAWKGQALIGLYKNYCSEKKCLNCSLGTAILRK